MFDLITGDSDIPHPLCKDCSGMFARKLEKQARTAEEELEAYRKYVEEIKGAKSMLGVMSVSDFRSHLASVRLKEGNILLANSQWVV
jgi:hypothetical protein